MRAKKFTIYEVNATIARSRPHRINLKMPKDETVPTNKIAENKTKCSMTKFVIIILRVAKLIIL